MKKELKKKRRRRRRGRRWRPRMRRRVSEWNTETNGFKSEMEMSLWKSCTERS